MSSTGLLWLLLYVAGCIAALVNPLYGLTTYLFAYYTNPPLHWWGEGLPGVRWSFTVSLILAASYVLHRAGRNSLGLFAHPQSKWLVALVGLAFALSHRAIDPTISYEYAVKLAKALVLYYLMVRIIDTPRSFRIVVAAHILGGVYWGLEALIDPQTEAGRLMNVGGPDTDTGNSTAAHILSILPFAGFAFLAGSGRERLLALVAAPLLIHTFELLNSRGAMLGMVVAFLATVWWGWRRFGTKLVLAGVSAAVVLLVLAGPKFWERQSSTLKPEDHSALSRLDFWRAAIQLMKDHPLGVGGQGFDLMSPVYLPEEVERKDDRLITVHNTYLLTGSEWGFLGLGLFLLFLLATLRQLRRLMKLEARTEVQRRIQVDALAVAAALVGVLVAGMFGNRLYGEAIYWLAALSGALATLWARDAEASEAAQAESPAPRADARLAAIARTSAAHHG